MMRIKLIAACLCFAPVFALAQFESQISSGRDFATQSSPSSTSSSLNSTFNSGATNIGTTDPILGGATAPGGYGQGTLADQGTANINKCRADESDPGCNAVNMMANYGGRNVKLPANDPMLVASQAAINASGSGGPFSPGTQCQTVTTTTPPPAIAYTSKKCTRSATVADKTCNQSLSTTIAENNQNANESYSCSGGSLSGKYCVASDEAPAPTIYSCASGQTLSGSNCITPNGSVVPASIPSYGCPADEVLSGSSCTKKTSTEEAATISPCPAGYTFNGGWCAQTVTSEATPGYSCSSSTITIDNGPTKPPTCQKIYDRFLTACPSVTQNFLGSGTSASLISSQFFGSCKVSWQGQVYNYVNWTCNGDDAQVFYGNKYVCQQIDPPTISSYSCTAPAVLSGSSCVTTTTIAETVIYSCRPGGTLSGSTCTYTTTSVSAATPKYSCSSGYSLSGTSCIGPSTIAATINYTCPSGSTLSGSGANSICTTVTTTPATVNYSCADGSAPKNGLCTIYSVTSAWQDGCSALRDSANAGMPGGTQSIPLPQ